jgi:ketosteroid isomerase-like protein
MTIATDLLERHIRTLVADTPQWKSLIADDIIWELPYAAGIGHPLRLSGRSAVEAHVDWFLKAVQEFNFYDLRTVAAADPESAVAEVRAQGIIRATGRVYRQEYVFFLKSTGNKISFLREYFNPVRAAQALDIPILPIQA